MENQHEAPTISYPNKLEDIELVDAAHPGTDRCPACGFNNWYIVQGPGSQVAMLPTGEVSNSVLHGTGHALVALTCQQCGYLKMHIRELFDAYVKQLKDQQGCQDAS